LVVVSAQQSFTERIMHHRPYRSVLYIPGSKERALEKVTSLAADAIIFDLEDAVAPDEKGSARHILATWLGINSFAPRAGMVRINALDTEWGAADLEALRPARPAAILLPKVNGAGDIAALAARLDGAPEFAQTRIWAMMETPMGVLNAAQIATAPRMEGFIMGTNDLAKDLNCRHRTDRLPLITALSHSLMAARMAGIVAVDGVYNSFRDDAGLEAECNQGRDLGFDGKTLIHPAQIDIANRCFAPAEAELDLAQRQITAFNAALAAGQGVAVVDGKIVENLHIESARALLARAEAISQLQKGL
jgi:(3S)-malyl-CoA thioesterase